MFLLMINVQLKFLKITTYAKTPVKQCVRMTYFWNEAFIIGENPTEKTSLHFL